ncbi:MAG: TonB-dependent receptor [Planctomycetota bacterium]
MTFATGLTAQLTEHTSVYGSISRGFRAPNLDDLAILGDFSAGDRIPSLDLDPEKVLNFEMGSKYATPAVRAGACAAAAFYQDLLENKFVFDDAGTDVFQVDNVSRARILSLEGWLECVVSESHGTRPQHVVFTNAFWSVGRNMTDHEPVSKVPPAEATLGYRLEGVSDEWFAESDVRGAARQNRLSAADQADPRFAEGGTPGWWTFNLRGGIDVAAGVRLSAALENVFNYRYRIHGSGIDAPGRNAVLSLDWRF